MKKKIIIGFILFLIVAQFFRPDRRVSEVDPKGTLEAMNLVDGDVQSLLEGACYDCHSNKTTYPWYANIAPVSWWLQGHVNNGRNKLNFSIWNSYSKQRQALKIEETIEVMENMKMPPASYAIMHKAGRIDEAKAQQIVEAFKKLQN